MSKVPAAAIWAKPWEAPPVWGGSLTLGDGHIRSIGTENASGDHLLIPGLINAHDHGRGLRPLAFGAPDGPLEAWLWDLWRAPSSDVYLTALVAFGHMALSGVTTVVHNHLPQSHDLVVEAQEVARAARDVGLRLAFVTPILDQNLAGYDGGAAVRAALDPRDWSAIEAVQSLPPVTEQVEAVAEIAVAIDGPTIVTQYGPPGPQWLSEEGWSAVGEKADDDGRRVHVHLLETQLQRAWMDAVCPDGAHHFFAKAGLLNDQLTVAHGVFLLPDEMVALHEAGVTLVLNTSSNLRLGSGVADGAALSSGGMRLGIGLDGMALDDDADMLREVRLAAMLLGPRRFDQDGLDRSQIMKAAFCDGRFAFDGKSGEGLIAGADADYVALSLDAIAPDRLTDDPETLADLIIGRASRAAVRQVVVAGETIVDDGALTRIDLPAAERALTKAGRAAPPAPSWIAKARAARTAAASKEGP